jgi:hypothetical protein
MKGDVMNEKTLFSIFLPATASAYEMWIPHELSVIEATQLVCRILMEQENRYFVSDANTALYDKASGTELEGNRRVGELDYPNGTELLLI